MADDDIYEWLCQAIITLIVVIDEPTGARGSEEDLSGGARRAARARRLDPANDVADVLEVRDLVAGDHVDGASGRPAAARFREEIGDVHGQGGGDPGQAIETDVDFPAFDLPDMLPGSARAFRELFLAPTVQQAKPKDYPADAGANRAFVVSHDARLFDKPRGPTTSYMSC